MVVNKKLIKRVLIYLLGMYILSLGFVLSINAGLGVGPGNATPYVVSEKTGIKVGTLVFILHAIFVFIQWLLLRADFKKIQFIQLFFSFFLGGLVNIQLSFLETISFDHYVYKLFMLLLSIFMTALGISTYRTVGLVDMPVLGIADAIRTKTERFTLSQLKVIIDSTNVLIGIILSLLFFHQLVGIREGTILSALFVGRMIPKVQKISQKIHDLII